MPLLLTTYLPDAALDRVIFQVSYMAHAQTPATCNWVNYLIAQLQLRRHANQPRDVVHLQFVHGRGAQRLDRREMKF
jgi:hypothetical protein